MEGRCFKATCSAAELSKFNLPHFKGAVCAQQRRGEGGSVFPTQLSHPFPYTSRTQWLPSGSQGSMKVCFFLHV